MLNRWCQQRSPTCEPPEGQVSVREQRTLQQAARNADVLTVESRNRAVDTFGGHVGPIGSRKNKAKMRAPLSALCFVVMAAVVLADVSEAPAAALPRAAVPRASRVSGACACLVHDGKTLSGCRMSHRSHAMMFCAVASCSSHDPTPTCDPPLSRATRRAPNYLRSRD